MRPQLHDRPVEPETSRLHRNPADVKRIAELEAALRALVDAADAQSSADENCFDLPQTDQLAAAMRDAKARLRTAK